MKIKEKPAKLFKNRYNTSVVNYPVPRAQGVYSRQRSKSSNCCIASSRPWFLIYFSITSFLFATISLIYYKKFNYTTPLQTAIVFVFFVVFMDVFVVALLIEKSFEMFTNILGTWIPFALIFVSAYLTGLYAKK